MLLSFICALHSFVEWTGRRTKTTPSLTFVRCTLRRSRCVLHTQDDNNAHALIDKRNTKHLYISCLLIYLLYVQVSIGTVRQLLYSMWVVASTWRFEGLSGIQLLTFAPRFKPYCIIVLVLGVAEIVGEVSIQHGIQTTLQVRT